MDGELARERFMFFPLKLHYGPGEREHLVPLVTFLGSHRRDLIVFSYPHNSPVMTYQLSPSICDLTRVEKSNRVTLGPAI